MAKETNEQARLRLFLAEYERVCKRYSLRVGSAIHAENRIYERSLPNGWDELPEHLEQLREGGINA